MPRTRVAAVLLAGCLLWPAAAAALDPARRLTQHVQARWGAEQGLPGGLFALAQGPDGDLWIGTDLGLVRFDGVRFTLFDRANTPELPHSMAAALAFDRAGRLWIGTRRGLACLEAGRFTSHDTKAGLPDARIASLLEDRAGTLWVGTLGGGLLRRDGERFTPVAGLPGQRVRALRQDREGRIWAATEAGLARLDGGRVATFTKRDGLPDDSGFDVLEDRDGALWVGTEGGLARRDGELFHAFTTRDGLPSNRIRSLAQDRTGALWIGTEDGGLVRMRPGGFESITAGRGFPSDSVSSILEDAESNLWVATSNAGLVRLQDGPVASLGEPEGLPAGPVFSVSEGRDGSLWLGTRRGGLVQWKDGVRRALTTRDGLGSNLVTGVVEDPEGTLWIGTYGGGLGRLRGGRLDVLRGPRDLLGNDVYALLAARDGSLWVATGGGGLDHFERSRRTSYTEKDGLPSVQIQALHEDAAGAIWIGTGAGLARLQAGRIESWTTANGLPGPSILSFHDGPDGSLWIGTFGDGLVRLAQGRFSQLTRREGLPVDSIGAILAAEDGAFWMSTPRGLFRATPGELEAALAGHRLQVPLLGPADGMRSAEGYSGSGPCAWRGRDGRLWFGNVQGVVAVDPGWSPPAAPAPPLRIEAVRAAGVALDGAGPARLPSGARSIEVHYTASYLRAPERASFRYRLEGFDSDWIEAGSRRTAYYPRLPGGSYTFLVAAGEPGSARASEARLALAVDPALHERRSVQALLLGVLGLAGYGAHRLRTWRLQQRQRELELQVAQRTEELRQANHDLGERKREVEEKNENITAAIRYAWRIQRATLPVEGELERRFTEAGVLYLPRDIVSGDFYWCAEKAGFRFLAVADCTGHGVPGGFLSMLGSTSLDDIVLAQGVLEPGRVLELLHRRVVHALRQDQGGEASDGMEIGLLRFGGPATLFAGARMPVFVVEGSAVSRVRGDREPIGGERGGLDRTFLEHPLAIGPGACLVLVSDGFFDQIGEDGRRLGTKRFEELLAQAAGAPASACVASLHQAFLRHRGDAAQLDDVTLVVVRP